jgi:hypothetical protein
VCRVCVRQSQGRGAGGEAKGGAGHIAVGHARLPAGERRWRRWPVPAVSPAPPVLPPPPSPRLARTPQYPPHPTNHRLPPCNCSLTCACRVSCDLVFTMSAVQASPPGARRYVSPSYFELINLGYACGVRRAMRCDACAVILIWLSLRRGSGSPPPMGDDDDLRTDSSDESDLSSSSDEEDDLRSTCRVSCVVSCHANTCAWHLRRRV